MKYILAWAITVAAFPAAYSADTTTFKFAGLLGKWTQTQGQFMGKAKNELSLSASGADKVIGTMKINESRKTIHYQLEFVLNPATRNWTLFAVRDKQKSEWMGQVEGNTIYFVREFNEGGEHYFSRQGFFNDAEGALIRTLEKSFDGKTYQGIEERYTKEASNS